jgi:hypothetical protein
MSQTQAAPVHILSCIKCFEEGAQNSTNFLDVNAAFACIGVDFEHMNLCFPISLRDLPTKSCRGGCEDPPLVGKGLPELEVLNGLCHRGPIQSLYDKLIFWSKGNIHFCWMYTCKHLARLTLIYPISADSADVFQEYVFPVLCHHGSASPELVLCSQIAPLQNPSVLLRLAIPRSSALDLSNKPMLLGPDLQRRTYGKTKKTTDINGILHEGQ